MGDPLFCLGIEFREELQKDGLTAALREQFSKYGHALSDDVSVQLLGTEYLIIDGEPDHDSYTRNS